jgi:hypothetical protein
MSRFWPILNGRLDDLISRASSQADQLEELRIRAASRSFGQL